MVKVRVSMAKFDLNELPPMEEDVPAEEAVHDALVVCEEVPNGAHQVHAGADTVLYRVTKPSQTYGSNHSEPPDENRDFTTQVAWVRWLLPKYVDSCERARVERCSPDEFRMPTSVSRQFLKLAPESPTPEEVSTLSDVTSAFSTSATAGYFAGMQQGESSRTTTNLGANRDRFYINESYWPESDNDRPTQRMSMMDETVPATGKRARRT